MSDHAQPDQSPDIDDDDDAERWCVSCGDTFRYDDCGGYNPPCPCGLHCRSCHENECDEWDDDDDDLYPEDETAE